MQQQFKSYFKWNSIYDLIFSPVMSMSQSFQSVFYQFNWMILLFSLKKMIKMKNIQSINKNQSSATNITFEFFRQQLYQKMSIRQCEAVLKFTDGRVFKNAKSIECLPQHSLSSIQALSDYFSQKFPSLIPPTSFPIDKQLLDRSNSPKYNSTFQLWNYFVGECFLSGLAYRRQHIIYIVLPLVCQTPEFFDIESSQCIQITSTISAQASNTQILKAAFNIPDLIRSQKKMGICMVNPNNKLQYNVPKCLVDLLILGIFYDNQEWRIFNVASGQVIQVQELVGYNALIITGSGESVLNQSNVYKESVTNIATAVQQSDSLKVMAICYGHQWIAQHYGALVVKKEKKGGIEDIIMHPQIVQKYVSIKGIKGFSQILLSQHHEDYVQTVPEGFQLLAHSASSKVESLISNDGKILTSQFHSQITFQYMKRLVDELNSCNVYSRWRYPFNECKERIDRHCEDSIAFLELIRGFINQ